MGQWRSIYRFFYALELALYILTCYSSSFNNAAKQHGISQSTRHGDPQAPAQVMVFARVGCKRESSTETYKGTVRGRKGRDGPEATEKAAKEE